MLCPSRKIDKHAEPAGSEISKHPHLKLTCLGAPICGAGHKTLEFSETVFNRDFEKAYVSEGVFYSRNVKVNGLGQQIISECFIITNVLRHYLSARVWQTHWLPNAMLDPA